jgi:hypothetical protein
MVVSSATRNTATLATQKTGQGEAAATEEGGGTAAAVKGAIKGGTMGFTSNLLS